jgi:hypothetical protein
MLVLSAGRPALSPKQIPSVGSGPPNFADRGVFLLSAAGRTVGTEKFEIRSSAHEVEAQADIHLHIEQNGKLIDLETFPKLVLDGQLNPLSYKWSQKGPQPSQLEVDFRAAPAKARFRTLSGEDDVRDFDLPRNVVLLDDNVIHHYQLIVDRYRMAGGGKQTFHAFIPQEALPGTVTIEDAGPSAPNVEGGAANQRHLVVTTELAHIDLWVDAQQRLQRISIPEAQLEAIRKK